MDDQGFAPGSILLFLVGNGSYDENELSKNEIQELDKKHKLIAAECKLQKYFEVSSVSGHNITGCMTDVIKHVLLQDNFSDTTCFSHV